MGRLPAILVALVVLWVALNVIRHGPANAFGGLFDAFTRAQYGEADRPTRSGTLADEALAEPRE